MTAPPISLQTTPGLPLAEFYNVNPAHPRTPDPMRRRRLPAAAGSTLIRCLDAAFDDYDSFAPEESTYDVRALRAVVSPLGEKEVRTLAGRGVEASRQATLGEIIRVYPNRPGQADLLVTIPDAAAIGVEGAGNIWTVTVTPKMPDPAEQVSVSIPVAHPVAFGTGTISLGTLDRDEYRVYRVADVRPDRHPFTGVTKNTIYLQEVVG
ncbi:MAG: hypothetical protein RJR34_13070 [Candidatus Methanoculleus thermohydrogenotrophicum]|nr:hypothetical protein [Candidatus Methanoculleus thermohydrogenotrophicum]